jgi:hypothetical protein
MGCLPAVWITRQHQNLHPTMSRERLREGDMCWYGWCYQAAVSDRARGGHQAVAIKGLERGRMDFEIFQWMLSGAHSLAALHSAEPGQTTRAARSRCFYTGEGDELGTAYTLAATSFEQSRMGFGLRCHPLGRDAQHGARSVFCLILLQNQLLTRCHAYR